MKNPYCMRCKVEITMPDGRKLLSYFTASKLKYAVNHTLEQSVARQLARYHLIVSERFGAGTTVRITEPCSMSMECG